MATKEQISEKNRRNYLARRDELLEDHARWRAENPGYFARWRAANHRRVLMYEAITRPSRRIDRRLKEVQNAYPD